MKSRTILLGILCTCGAVMATAQIPPYLNTSAPIEDRVQDALSRMTREEKIAMIHAQSKFSSPGVPRLGIPEVWCTDGPHGIRPEVKWDRWEQAGWTNDSCFAFPALTCLAATWNVDMSELYGRSIGEEARYRKKTVLLGPGVNIYRTPLNGRNFEYMGEDPFLSGEMVVPYIRGVQQNGVAACVKHYALNNQESYRGSINVDVDERTLYELYLPAFKKAVTVGHTWTIMGAYNKYKHQHCCHNQYLLNDILKKDWAFDGVVVSDWGGTHDTRQAALNGLDLEYGTGTNGLNSGTNNAYDNYYMGQPYLNMIKEGKLTTKELDDKVSRVLRLIFRTEMSGNRPFGALVSDSHIAAGREIGDEGVVLLKNEKQILPIPSTAHKILLVGENALKMMTVGGGSSSLKVKKEVSPLEGLRQVAPSGVEISWERGYVGDITGEYNGVVSGQDLNDSRTPSQLISAAVTAAKASDYVIFIGGLNKSDNQDCEGTDRKDLNLPYGQDDVIEALSKVSKNLVVVNISGNAVAMPWVKNVPAIIQGWYIGSEAGNVLADILFGKVNPSGKLPMTFPKNLNDVPAHRMGDYPGKKVNGEWTETYKEGLYVGYRGVDKFATKPLFAFGYGLSYTTFKYGKAVINKSEMNSDNDSLIVKVPIKNVGKRSGKEIVQLYIHDVQASVDRPYKELKGFCKLSLQPGEEKLATFVIKKDALSFFDVKEHTWVAEPGKFEVLVAASSDDIRSKTSFNLK